MFLRRKYRDRMIGLIGAYAVLVTGIVFTGAVDSAPDGSAPTEAGNMQMPSATLGRTKAGGSDDRASALQERSDSVC